MTETRQTQQKEAILALPVPEAIKQFGMEGAVTILESHGYDRNDINDYINRGFPFQKFGKPGEATALSVSNDLESITRWRIYYNNEREQAGVQRIDSLVAQIKEIKELKTKYEHGEKKPLLDKFGIERDLHLDKIISFEEYLPEKDDSEKSFLISSEKWSAQSRDKRTKSIFAGYFLDHAAAYLTIDRAMKKEQPVVKS